LKVKNQKMLVFAAVAFAAVLVVIVMIASNQTATTVNTTATASDGLTAPANGPQHVKSAEPTAPTTDAESVNAAPVPNAAAANNNLTVNAPTSAAPTTDTNNPPTVSANNLGAPPATK
jgi:hypothetical protein